MAIGHEEVMSPFQLGNYRIISLHIESDLPKDDSEARVEFSFDYEKEQEKPDDYSGALTLHINATCNDETTQLFYVSLSIQGLFSADKNSMDEATFSQMLEVNGLTVLSQLARTQIMASTGLWGIGPAVIIPMINVHELIKGKKELPAEEKPEEE
jgi:preprotein translocase subunit SecB